MEYWQIAALVAFAWLGMSIMAVVIYNAIKWWFSTFKR